MPDQITVTVDWGGVDIALEDVSRFGDDLRPLGPVLGDEWFYPLEREQFASEGARGGGWTPLNTSYAKAKADKYGNLPVLQLPDRRLLRSLTEKGAEGAVADFSEKQLIYGSSVFYAATQDDSRSLIEPTESDYDRAGELVARELVTFARAQELEAV